MSNVNFKKQQGKHPISAFTQFSVATCEFVAIWRGRRQWKTSIKSIQKLLLALATALMFHMALLYTSGPCMDSAGRERCDEMAKWTNRHKNKNKQFPTTATTRAKRRQIRFWNGHRCFVFLLRATGQKYIYIYISYNELQRTKQFPCYLLSQRPGQCACVSIGASVPLR